MHPHRIHFVLIQDRSSVHDQVPKGPFQNNWSRSRGHVGFYWFPHTLIESIVLPPRANTWAMAMCQGAMSEQSTTFFEALLTILIFHAHLWKPWFYNQGSNLESWTCAARPILENLPPVQTPMLAISISSTPIYKICFSSRTALRSLTRCQRGHSRKAEVGPEAGLAFIDFHRLW